MGINSVPKLVESINASTTRLDSKAVNNIMVPPCMLRAVPDSLVNWKWLLLFCSLKNEFRLDLTEGVAQAKAREPSLRVHIFQKVFTIQRCLWENASRCYRRECSSSPCRLEYSGSSIVECSLGLFRIFLHADCIPRDLSLPHSRGGFVHRWTAVYAYSSQGC